MNQIRGRFSPSPYPQHKREKKVRIFELKYKGVTKYLDNIGYQMPQMLSTTKIFDKQVI